MTADDKWNVQITSREREVGITDMGQALLIRMRSGDEKGLTVSLDWITAEMLYEALASALTHGRQPEEMADDQAEAQRG